MILSLSSSAVKEKAETYKSVPQQVRFLSESWVKGHVYCPNCGRPHIEKYANNQPVADFVCPDCLEDFELKSMRGALAPIILDGAYRTMLERLRSSQNPNLFLLSYDILDLLAIPKQFFVPALIEERKALSSEARRAGRVGCNIRIKEIPEAGRIFLVNHRRAQSKKSVLISWGRTKFLRDERELDARGWLLDIIACIDKTGSKEFTLDDLYGFELDLRAKHPANRHIRDKIRQQLQILRDKKYLVFLGRGHYRVAR